MAIHIYYSMKKNIFFWFLLFSTTTQAQYSPEKKYNPSYLKLDSVTKSFRRDYQVKAPIGAPNILIIMLDDVGYSTSSTFGGIAQTPFFDTLAGMGLKYTNFHTTGICAPSRAALLTGRNQHSVHMGHFTETAFDAPGYDGYMPFEKATIAEVLKENGYNTFAVGKWHLTPVLERTAAGPFNRWPTGRGFERFYGFHESATDQYYPVIWEGINRASIDTGKGEHLNKIITDKAIQYISQQKKSDNQKPFFMLFAPGATHSPLQVDKEWIDMYKGKFDMGYDKYREVVLEQQKKLGVVPSYVTLHPRHKNIIAWDSLPWMAQKVFARSMEAHAGFLSQTDHEIGKLVNYIKSIGELDNTVIFLIIGDNGATKFMAQVPGVPADKTNLSFDEQVKIGYENIDKIGLKDYKGDYPLGWAQATNTPFRLFKLDANGEGGTHNPLIVVAPQFIHSNGQIREQYTHLIDLWPTIIEMTGVKMPKQINGYLQQPLEGTSFAYSFDKKFANDKHELQYFEAGSHRALYYKGWKASVFHTYGKPYTDDQWELYDMKIDFNERNDLSKKYPNKLKELVLLFEAEAKKYHVYPLQESWFPNDEYLQISDSRHPQSKQ